MKLAYPQVTAAVRRGVRACLMMGQSLTSVCWRFMRSEPLLAPLS
nr:MAG TPA: hypothetical protein [Caudoviricetes sp.]